MKKENRMRSLAVLMAAVMTLGGCAGSADTAGTEETEAADTALAVEASAPETGSLAVSSTFIGTVSPQEQVSIIPLVSGEVAAVNFEVGDHVQAGDVLLQIDDEAARLQLESAKLTKEGAELSAQRTLGSSQVMSNLSMESNLKNIQYQIDMAKKQYDSAGTSIADTQQKKEDMKSALNKINDSIGDMEENYKSMKSMAVTAKQFVYQDANGVWRWVTDPEPNWKELYYTEPGEGGETKPDVNPDPNPDPDNKPDSGQNPDSNINPSDGTKPDENTDKTNGSGEESNGGSASEGGSQENGGKDPDSQGSPDKSPSEEEHQGTDGGGQGSASQDSSTQGTASQDSSSQGSSSQNSSSQDSSAQGSSAQEAPSQESTSASQSGAEKSSHNESTQSSELQSRAGDNGAVRKTSDHENHYDNRSAQTAAAAQVSFRTGNSLNAGIGKGGRHGCGNDEPEIMQAVAGIGNNSDIVILQIDNQDGTKKKSYEEYVKDKAIYEGKLEAVNKFRSAGYSAADIGEGRLDSSLSTYASQIASMKTQASSLESNISSIDSSIDSAETSRSTTGDTIDFYEENLKDAQVQYGIQNGQAYQDTAAALQNQIASSDVGIQNAMMQLENYTLTAPISGVIEQKNVDEFGMVSAGNPVYVISNKDSMTVTFYVSEAVKNQLTAGETITLERNGETFTAGITQIGQSVDSRTGLFEIKAATENTQLSNGVTVKITADTYRTNDALLLPYDAVYYEAEQAYVYCVEDGIAVKTPVETGLYNEDKIEITGGLAADSIVIHTWSSQLTDGAKVRLVEGEDAE